MIGIIRQFRQRRKQDERRYISLAYLTASFRDDHRAMKRFKRDYIRAGGDPSVFDVLLELPPPGPSNIVVRTPNPLKAPERVEEKQPRRNRPV